MTLVLNQKTGVFTLFMMPEHSSSIFDKFHFAGASAEMIIMKVAVQKKS